MGETQTLLSLLLTPNVYIYLLAKTKQSWQKITKHFPLDLVISCHLNLTNSSQQQCWRPSKTSVAWWSKLVFNLKIPTGFWVFHLSDTAIGGGPFVVVLGQGEGADTGSRRAFAAGGLRLLQATVVVTLLGRVLLVLHWIGSGKRHSAMGELQWRRGEGPSVRQQSNYNLGPKTRLIDH